MNKKVPSPSFFDKDTFIIMMVVCCGIVATLSVVIFDSPDSPTESSLVDSPTSVRSTIEGSSEILISSEKVPLSTGDEPIGQLFVQSGCAVCHTIPGIEAAKGRQGPKLELRLNGPKRLVDPNYNGTATTVREYIIESILNPGAYVVPGYPDRVMPRWYGKKLNAKALDRISLYLEVLPDGIPAEESP